MPYAEPPSPGGRLDLWPGQVGERAADPGHDLGYCGLAGSLSLNARHDGVPDLPALPLADMAGGANDGDDRLRRAFARERTAARWLDFIHRGRRP